MAAQQSVERAARAIQWKIEQAGRSGRARTCDPRFWRPSLSPNDQGLSRQHGVKPGCEHQRVSSVLSNLSVVQRDDGKWSIGWDDEADGPFESRAFALRIASGDDPTPAPVAKFRRIRELRRASS